MKLTNTFSMVSTLVSFLVLSSACTPSFDDSGDGGGDGNGNCDADMDGYNRQGCDDDSGRPDTDCNDHNDGVHPNAAESCNGKDDNCNGQVDEGLSCGNPQMDSDGDGDPDSTDCFPNDPSRHHGCAEICGNGQDDNCSGSIDEGCSTSSTCQSCNGSTGNGNPSTTTGGGSNNATCQVQLSLSGMQSSGAIYAFGEFQDGNYIPFEAHWAAVNACSPNAQGSLCQFSGGACGFTVKNNSYVLMQVSAQDSSVALTGCRHLGDQGCWSGGGHQQMNGSLTVKVNGNNTGFTTEDNADNLDKPGGDCAGSPGNTADPACCKYSTEEKVTANIRVWIHC